METHRHRDNDPGKLLAGAGVGGAALRGVHVSRARRLVPPGGPGTRTRAWESRGLPGTFQNGRRLPKWILSKPTTF